MNVGCAAELLSDLADDETGLPNRRMIDHRASVGLEIHPLAYAHIHQRIAGRESKWEAPVKNVAVRLAVDNTDDVVGGTLVTVRVEPADAPGTMLSSAISELQILFQMEDIALPPAGCFSHDTLQGLTCAEPYQLFKVTGIAMSQ